ncbi:MAG: hypothetical protein IJX25_03485 [Clostridia bacterium]|nr:hypothetical protein [Clostridia bacterium]
MKLIDELLEREHESTILKLKGVFKLGHLPIRGDEPYYVLHMASNQEVTFLVNCMAHSFFNLTNDQLENYNEFDAKNFRQFYWPDDSEEEVYNRILKFVRKTGLSVVKTTESCKPKKGQWKVGVYFLEREKKECKVDFHFILRESDGRWSSKEGSYPELIYYDKLPEFLQSDVGNRKRYKFHGYLMVTNPHVYKETIKEGIEANTF